jgi:hypothetical protein
VNAQHHGVIGTRAQDARMTMALVTGRQVGGVA